MRPILKSTKSTWKINMEPTNHPFRKEHDLPSLHEDMFHVNLQGCNFFSKSRSASCRPNCFSMPKVIQRTIWCLVFFGNEGATGRDLE